MTFGTKQLAPLPFAGAVVVGDGQNGPIERLTSFLGVRNRARGADLLERLCAMGCTA